MSEAPLYRALLVSGPPALALLASAASNPAMSPCLRLRAVPSGTVLNLRTTA